MLTIHKGSRLKLYVLSQDANSGYDTYDSAVVAAYTREQARRTHPSGGKRWCESHQKWEYEYSKGHALADTHNASSSDVWAEPHAVEAEFIGYARGVDGPGVIVASFNAG